MLKGEFCVLIARQVDDRRDKPALYSMVVAADIGGSFHAILVAPLPNVANGWVFNLVFDCELALALCKGLGEGCSLCASRLCSTATAGSAACAWSCAGLNTIKAINVLDVANRELPCAVEAAQDSYNSACSNGQLRGCKVGEVGCAHNNGVALGIYEVARAVTACLSIVELTAICEVYTRQTNKCELVSVGCFGEFGEIREILDVDEAFIGPAILEDVLLEGFIRCAIEVA